MPMSPPPVCCKFSRGVPYLNTNAVGKHDGEYRHIKSNKRYVVTNGGFGYQE